MSNQIPKGVVSISGLSVDVTEQRRLLSIASLPVVCV